MKKPTPTQSESPFGFDEFFFSTTDSRGVILFGNDVFMRISGYSQETMIGAPHSIIRHPDMPRAVFKLLWDTIKAGSPIAAYVKNMSANGNFYWVFAFVFPIENGEYLSIRFKPSSALFKAAQALYPLTLEVEDKEGMDGSIPFLLDNVGKAGFKDYTDFMIQAAFAEINILQEKNKESGRQEEGDLAEKISHISRRASADLKGCFTRVQEFQNINQSFSGKMNVLMENFQNLKFIVLNMTISAAKLGEEAASLGVVAKEFSDLSEQIKAHLTGLFELTQVLSSVIQKCALEIVALEAQMMMVDFFVKESLKKISTSKNVFSTMIENRKHFSYLFKKHSQNLTIEIGSLRKNLNEMSEKMGDVRKFTTGLEVIRQMGSIESSRDVETKQMFLHYLQALGNFVSLLQSSGTGIEKELRDLQVGSEYINLVALSLEGTVDSVFDVAASFSEDENSNAS
ncbi:MAG: hypothetical protein OM95_14030 [Bdellovibrio sp. ArHS]|uniref:PAS domain-containing protein n=1 Tax=Bdellovibrio sp. ArHS TaxID=1569284 RepID=UPI000582A479|nr:PAS domain-containing protein [Bdellovibrio sp. ArHS]KHD87554.1 MAG: hypothetical protein OM95_14030 [Bdellovibrio sp. ArHS]